MGRNHSRESIVLQTHDVGEADRFCILFSRENGRLSARARGARKPNSKLAAATLPLQEARFQLAESSGGWHINGADILTPVMPKDAAHLCLLSAAAELVQHLTHDDEPLPEVYDLLRDWLRTAHEHTHLLHFTVRLLTLLGVLSVEQETLAAAFTQATDRDYMCIASGEAWQTAGAAAPTNVTRFCENLLQEQTGRQWRVPLVSRQLL